MLAKGPDLGMEMIAEDSLSRLLLDTCPREDVPFQQEAVRSANACFLVGASSCRLDSLSTRLKVVPPDPGT